MASYDTAAVHTAVELAKRTNNKEQLQIAMLLAKENQFFETAKWKEANRLDADLITQQKTVPTPTVRGYNEGVSPTVMQTAQIVQPICLVEDRSEIDEAIVDDAPNPRKYRYDEDLGHMEGMIQKVVDLFLNGSLATDPKSLDGINTRFSAYSMVNVHNNEDATGAAVTSVYLVQWGPKGVYLTYPAGGKQLIQRLDKGKIWRSTSASDEQVGLWKYVTQFKVKLGLSIRDNRCLQRIANIGTTTSNTLSLELVIAARNLMPRMGEGSIMYVNRRTQTQLDILALTKNNIVYRQDDNFGKPQTMVQGIPVKMLEGIKITQAVLAS